MSEPSESLPIRLETLWRMSPTIGKLVEAITKAALKFDPVLKDSDNPAYRSKYADLPTVIDATRKYLAAEGVAVIQMPHAEFGPEDAKMMTLTTMLAHSSGEWMASELTLPAMMRDRFDAQSVGSAITYARRYGLAAMTNVAQEDDDGNKASGIGTQAAADAVAKRKIKESAPNADPNEPITLVSWKEGQLAITGNSLALLRAEMTAEDRDKLHIKWSGADKTWAIPEAEGHMFASLAEKHKFKVVWKD
jgi:ERF superfamily